MSKELIKYQKKQTKNKLLIISTQLSIVLIFLFLWEYLTNKEIINSFIYSSPSLIIKTIVNLIKSNNLFIHIWTTFYEVIISFILGIFGGLFMSILLYKFKFFAKVIDPFLTILNSLPKVALGPLIIIIVGANVKSIIVMALLINLIVSIITIYNGFLNTDVNKIRLFNSFNASKKQILFKLVIPCSFKTIISSLKLNISMSLIGVIMGEFLVSKRGIGYLIIYGTQVFNLNLVMSGIIILLIISFLLYKIVLFIEKRTFNDN